MTVVNADLKALIGIVWLREDKESLIITQKFRHDYIPFFKRLC